ncbi:MAG TPA: site-specific integrase [Myxococcota bacterium]|nr:site-specific integrase [Myxococcota bacterium]
MARRSDDVGVKVRFFRGSWWVVVHHQGKRRQKRIGRDKRLAEQVAKEIRTKLLLGEFSVRPTAEAAIPFDRFAQDWLHIQVELPIKRNLRGALSLRSRDIHEGNLRRHLVPFFAGRDLRKIRAADVQALHDHLLVRDRPLGAYSIEHVLKTLRQLLGFAELQEVVTENAVERWKRGLRLGRRRSAPTYKVRRDNVLDSEELARLLSMAAKEAPNHFGLLLFLADTGARLGEALGLRWIDVDLECGMARISRSFSDGKYLNDTKTGHERRVELSDRLRAELEAKRPDLFGDDTPVFQSRDGGLLDPHNFRARVFDRLVRRALGPARRFTPHGLRHTFATIHLARGTPIKWVQAQGGWASAKLLLDWYGHFLPSEQGGYANALETALDGAQTALRSRRAMFGEARRPNTQAPTRDCVAPRAGFEPATSAANP